MRRTTQVQKATLSTLNIDATRLSYELEALVHPTSLNDPRSQRNEAIEDTASKLAEFSKTVDMMASLLESERDPAQRAIWSKRVTGYRQKSAHFEKSWENRKTHLSMSQLHEEQRANLFSRREGDAVLDMLDGVQGAHEESASLQRSNMMTMESISTAAAVLQSLKEQGSILQRAQNKLKDIAVSLGLSGSLLRVIERREWGDAMIVYGGMIFTVIILYLVYSWTRS